jgi:hypothetical protein
MDQITELFAAIHKTAAIAVGDCCVMALASSGLEVESGYARLIPQQTLTPTILPLPPRHAGDHLRCTIWLTGMTMLVLLWGRLVVLLASSTLHAADGLLGVSGGLLRLLLFCRFRTHELIFLWIYMS